MYCGIQDGILENWRNLNEVWTPANNKVGSQIATNVLHQGKVLNETENWGSRNSLYYICNNSVNQTIGKQTKNLLKKNLGKFPDALHPHLWWINQMQARKLKNTRLNQVNWYHSVLGTSRKLPLYFVTILKVWSCCIWIKLGMDPFIKCTDTWNLESKFVFHRKW